MIAGPPDAYISPFGKPGETLGRKAMGAKAELPLGPPVKAQRSGFDGERWSSEMTELSAKAGSAGYGACDDEDAKPARPPEMVHLLLANQGKPWDAKLQGLKDAASPERGGGPRSGGRVPCQPVADRKPREIVGRKAMGTKDGAFPVHVRPVAGDFASALYNAGIIKERKAMSFRKLHVIPTDGSSPPRV